MNKLKIISLAGLALLDIAAAMFVWSAFSGAEAVDRLPLRSAPSIIPAAISDAPIPRQGEDSETLARPLFGKTRRPWQAASRAANEATVAPPPAGLKLHAIVGFNRSVRAFVTSSAAADGQWLSIGETFENWTVDSIAEQKIGLRRNADLLHFGLDYDASPVGSTPASLQPAKPDNQNNTPPPKVVTSNTDSAVRNVKRSER